MNSQKKFYSKGADPIYSPKKFEPECSTFWECAFRRYNINQQSANAVKFY